MRLAVSICFLGALSLFAQGPQNKRDTVNPDERLAFGQTEKVALLVGVGTYPRASGHDRLQFPGADVAALEPQLKALGYTVISLIDSEATRVAVSNSLNNVKNLLRGDGTLIFYFTGHGWAENGKNNLATFDAGARNLSDSGLKLDDVLDLVQKTGAKRQAIWIDACRNEPGKTEKTVGSGRSFGALNNATGTRILLSTKPGLTSRESAILRHGVFSYFLLEALQGKAFGGDKLLTVQDLTEYVIDKVSHYPLENGEFQVPVDATEGATRPDFLLADKIMPPRGPQPGDVQRNPVDGLRYVWIPPGTFQMGCSEGDKECRDDEPSPPKQVTITKGFWIGETEVTQAAYQTVVGDSQNPSYFRGATLPVDNVSWDEAKGFCEAVGARLPSEAEWEYAARAGSRDSRYGKVADIAWYKFKDSDEATHPVKGKQPNAWGLYDMLGNVLEWTNDWYGKELAGGTNPDGPREGEGRVVRGGAYTSVARGIRVSFRSPIVPSVKNRDYGFRCVSNQ